MTDEPRQKDKDVRNIRIGLAVTFGIVVSVALIVLLRLGLDWYLFSSTLDIPQRKDLVQGLASVIQALAVLVAGIIGLAGLYFTRRTLLYDQEALLTNQENTQRTLDLTEQGQITERFTRAIDQLGATDDKTTEPKVEIHLGGIYALERIAKDSPERDYSPVVEVLTAYVRKNAKWTPEASKEEPEPENEDIHQEHPLITQEISPRYAGIIVQVPKKLPLDIQSILDVLNRLREDPELQNYRSPPDLQTTDLEGANLFGADLFGALLYESNLKAARLGEADLRVANLERANLYGARLAEANLFQANLRGANLRGADLYLANLSGARHREGPLTFNTIGGEKVYDWGANLRGAHLQKASLYLADLRQTILEGADLQRAFLHRASLEGAHLQQADLRGADLSLAQLQDADLRNAVFRKSATDPKVSRGALRKANLRGADLTGVVGLDMTDISVAIGDERTKLPEGFEDFYRPKSWRRSQGKSK